MRGSTRAGFTFIEVMFALVIFAIAILGMTSGVGRFVSTVSTSERTSAAMQLAEDRINTVLADPNYLALDSTYATTETDFPGLPDVKRVTTIQTVGGPGLSNDYKRILVTVNGPGLSKPIKRSASVAAP